MSGLDIEDAESADTIVALFKHLITVLGKTDLSNKLADDIVWILLMEVCVCMHFMHFQLPKQASCYL